MGPVATTASPAAVLVCLDLRTLNSKNRASELSQGFLKLKWYKDPGTTWSSTPGPLPKTLNPAPETVLTGQAGVAEGASAG